MKGLTLFFLIFLLTVCLFSDQDVNEPDDPRINENFQIEANKTPSEKEEEEFFAFMVTVLFEDKTILSGLISFPKENLKVIHKKKDFLFRKTVKWEDVKSIKITGWKPTLKETIKSKNEYLYYFYPDHYEIIMKNSQKYEYRGNITYLNKLILTNKEDGSTDIYSFFMDYWKSTGKKEGYWVNAKTIDFYYPFNHPHTKSFTTINFHSRKD
ncbi:MAG: hypothetical protein JW827_01505 [Spirochaetes bacterium]|nr:hypothetical protein [Spirochaetota bacterium]